MDAWLAAHREPYWDTESTIWRAAIAAHLGPKAEAVRLIARGLGNGTGYSIALHAGFMLDPLRDFPAYQALIRREE
jgi:hypothetical protein